MTALAPKIDRLIFLLEEHEARALRQPQWSLSRELVVNTVLASVIGYFMFRILDHYFKKTKA